MWAWIKRHKWALLAVIGGAALLYWYLKHRQTAAADDSGASDLAAYAPPSVVYTAGGGGSVMASAPSMGVSSNPATAPAATAQPGNHTDALAGLTPEAQHLATTGGVAAPGTSPFNPGPSGDPAPPTGPGWDQGTQPTATLGEGGTAIPVASGDFTIAGKTRGIWLNALGYSSQASWKYQSAINSDPRNDPYRDMSNPNPQPLSAPNDTAAARNGGGGFLRALVGPPATGNATDQPIAVTNGTGDIPIGFASSLPAGR